MPPETQQFQSEKPKSITEILAHRRRRRVNPALRGLPDSTTLIREDRDRRPPLSGAWWIPEFFRCEVVL